MDINEIFTRKEPLHPELQQYYVKGDSWDMIQHPLVYSVPHIGDAMNAMLNERLKHLKASVEKAKERKDWSGYVFLHEKPWRLQAFVDIMSHTTPKEYWSLLGEIWVNSENIWQNKKVWKQLLTAKRPGKEFFMDEEDRKKYNELPTQLICWRGHQIVNKNGLSYTLDKDKALWFAHRFGKEGEIRERVVKKHEIFAYTNGRNEQELIII